jgi:hypothetical protein
MFETLVLRKIFGSKRKNVREEWRRLHNEELHDLYSSPHTIWLMKSKCMRWAGHVESYEKKRTVRNGFCGKTWRKGSTLKTQI